MKECRFAFIAICLLLCFTAAFNSKSEAQNIGNFSGKWDFTTEGSSFQLLLTQKENAITGSHCSTMLSGNKIDCFLNSTDLSITGTVADSNKVTIDFKSFFSGTTGKATLKKISATQIEFIIIEEPEGEFYLPDRATLTKK